MISRYDRKDFIQLKKIDAELSIASEKLNFLAINPSNIEAERKKVLKDSTYNPLFSYDVYDHDLVEVIEYLDSINKQDSLMGEVFEEQRTQYLIKANMLLNIGNKKFTRFSEILYGRPSPELVAKAETLLDLPVESKEKIIPVTNALDILKSEIIYFGFDYTINSKEMSADAAVQVDQRKIFLRKGATFSSNYLKQLTVHEIGTHVLRAENGKRQPFKMFVKGFPNYLSNEEGLAAYNEDRFGLLTNFRKKKYAARSIATYMNNKSFVEIYSLLKNHLPEPTAFTIAVRAKRGISDTALAGGCTKDYVYLDGYYKVKDFISKGGTINDLYYGKIGIEHVPLIKKINGLSRPVYLPKNESFKRLLDF